MTAGIPDEAKDKFARRARAAAALRRARGGRPDDPVARAAGRVVHQRRGHPRRRRHDRPEHVRVRVDARRARATGAATPPCPSVRARRHRQRPRDRRRHRARRRTSEQARLAVANCPERAIDHRGGEPDGRPPAGRRLGHRLRPHRRRVGGRPVPDLGRAAASAARSPTPTATAACGCRPATRTSPPIAYDTEHFTSRSVIVSEFRPPLELAPAGHRPADLVRPAVPPRRPPAAAAGVLAAGIAKLEPSTRAYCDELIDAMRGPRRRRRRRATTRSTSRCG